MLLSVSLLALASCAIAQEASYAPTLVTCPSTLITRTGSPLDGNQTLDASEEAYIEERRATVLAPLWSSYLADSSTGVTGYNLTQVFPSAANYPRLSTAVSGGGYRAALYGAGTLSALDSRNATNLGGILQLSDYLAGLSGGSWCVSSLAMNDLPDLFSLVLGENNQTGWSFDLGLLDPAGVLGISDNTDYFDILLADVQAKANAGYPVSLEDVWGRGLSFHFFNGTNRSNFYDKNATHDQGLLWSSIKYTLNFDNHAMPLPLVVSTSRVSEAQQTTNSSDLTVIPLSNTQFEFTPFTFGSFDPTLRARVPLEFAGTYLVDGVPLNASSCANGYENAGFVIGTSSALFNAVENELTDPTTAAAITTLGDDLGGIQNSNASIPLVSNWPNSFKNFVPSATATFESAGNDILQLTDGGENGENIPLSPLLVKARSQDIIIAIDGSADSTETWPNGTALIATSQRIAGYFLGNYSSFPPVPQTPEEFVSEGLNVRPTFFGCNITGSGNTSDLGSYPLVVYLPNAPPVNITKSTYLTNTTTLTLQYSTDDMVSFLEAAHLNALKGFQSDGEASDPDWPLCLKCATVERSRYRANVPRSAACSTCLNRYCWSEAVGASLGNGTTGAAGTTSKSSAPGTTAGGLLALSFTALSAAALAAL